MMTYHDAITEDILESKCQRHSLESRDNVVTHHKGENGIGQDCSSLFQIDEIRSLVVRIVYQAVNELPHQAAHMPERQNVHESVHKIQDPINSKK